MKVLLESIKECIYECKRTQEYLAEEQLMIPKSLDGEIKDEYLRLLAREEKALTEVRKALFSMD